MAGNARRDFRGPNVMEGVYSMAVVARISQQETFVLSFLTYTPADLYTVLPTVSKRRCSLGM